MLPLTMGSAEAARQQDGKSLQQLQREREQVRQQKTSQASQVNALKASDSEVTSALSALSSNVSAQQDRVEEAERAVAQATSEQQAAEAAQAQKQQELDAITAQMKTSAVEAYVTAGSGDTFATIGSDDINDAVNKRTLLSMRAGKDQGLVEQFRSVQEDLEIQRAAAQSAAEKARTKEAEVESRLDELNAAYSEQQQFAAQVEQRLDAALAEADSLASLDAGLSRSINDKQAEIARAVAAERAAREARAKASASRAAAVVNSGSGAGGGGGTAPSITGSGEIVTVGGIRIHQSVANNLAAMISAAAAAGISLSGGGYRDPAGQIAVRRNNCGSSNYAIYEMPASSCSPPTARPGSSMHERGLAIDFTQGGSTLTRGSSAFAWLKANAAGFGFYNLPSEPWHWSTNGN
ncbi:MAG: D-alanyl-D-alanine carboxypeptidase family protein [Microthrixaceae bacterium]